MSDNSTDSIPIAPSPCAVARPVLLVLSSRLLVHQQSACPPVTVHVEPSRLAAAQPQPGYPDLRNFSA